MTNHQQIKEWLAIYEQLSPPERQQVDDHLLHCQECTSTLAAYRTMDQQLQQLYTDKLYYLESRSPMPQQRTFPNLKMPPRDNGSLSRRRVMHTPAPRLVLLQMAGVGLLVLLFFVLFSGLIGQNPFEQHATAATPTSLRPTATFTATVAAPGVVVTNTTEPAVVRFVTYDWQETVYAPLVAQFEAANPDITIEVSSFQKLLGVEGYVWPDDALPRLLQNADLIDLNITPREAPRALIRDLAPLLAADPTIDSNDFYPNTLRADTADGGLWGLPMEISFNLLYYRKDLFDAASIPYPQPGWTWAEFVETAQALTQREGDEVSVWGFVNKWGDHTGVVESQTGPLFQGTEEEIISRLQSPSVSAAVQRYADLVQTARVSPFFVPSPPAEATGFTPESTLVELGQAAMWPDMAVNWQWNSDQGNIGVVPFPEGPEGQPSTLLSTRSRTMSTRNADPTAAWRWLSFLSRQTEMGIGHPLQLPQPALAEAAGAWQELDAATVAAMRYAIEHSYTRDAGYPYIIEQAFGDAITVVIQGESNAQSALDGLPTAVAALQQQATETAANPASPLITASEQALTATTTITYMIGYAGSDLTALRVLAQDFTAANPAIQVNVQYPPYQEGIFGLADITAASDCFDWSPIVYDPEQTHLLLSLDPFLAADPTIEWEDFFPGLLAQFTVNNQLWALPDEARPKVVIYNRARFDAAGLAYPTADWTTDDLATLATQLTQGRGPSKQYGFAGDYYELSDAELMMKRRGGQLYNLTQEPPGFAFTNPATVAAFDWYTALTLAEVKPRFTTSLGETQSDGMTFQQRAALINAGRVAMWTTVFGVQDSWYQLPNGLATGMVPLPLADDGTTINDSLFVAGYYISAATPHPDACWAWLRFLTEQPAASDGVPARQSVAASTAYREKVGAAVADVVVPLVANYTPSPDDQLLFTEPWLERVRPWWEEAYRQVAMGEATAATALEQAQQRATAYRQCIIDANGYVDETKQRMCIPVMGEVAE